VLVGIHKYKFHKKENNKILLDLNHRDKVLSSKINIKNNTSISGFRQSQAWVDNQHTYFYMEFSAPFKIEKIKNETKNNGLYKILSFKNSAVSIEGAKENLENKGESWDFNFYKKNAKTVWAKALNKINVKSKNEEKLTVFYSALYHTMIAPNTFSDVNVNYRGMDQQIHKDTLTTCTVFSLWDTFRAAHPLYTIIEQKRTVEFITTFLKHYEQGGRLPVWELSSNETECMIGYHSVSVITDAFNKGLQNFDTEKAL